MILGTALLIAALSLFCRNQIEAQRAGDSAAENLSKVIRQIEQTVEKEKTQGGIPDPYDTEMPEQMIDGYCYIGYLEIPDLKLQLPVLSEWNYENLRIAPCRYSGSVKSDDIVIAAHNYRQHFGNLSRLQSGQQVIYTDMNGVVYFYEVAAVDVLAPTAVKEMTAGDYDLSLFTCTYDGRSRVTVRCDRVTAEE